MYYIFSVQYLAKASWTWQAIENIYGKIITEQKEIRGKKNEIEGFQKCSLLMLKMNNNWFHERSNLFTSMASRYQTMFENDIWMNGWHRVHRFLKKHEKDATVKEMLFNKFKWTIRLGTISLNNISLNNISLNVPLD